MKIGKLDIKKAYYGSKELTTNNAFVGSVPLIDTPPTGWVTFKANQSSTIGLSRLSSYQKLLYSNNKKDWNVFDTSTSISMNASDEIYVAGILRRDINQNNYTNFSITGDVSVSGNIVYLWNYPNPKAPLKQWCGFNLFNGCAGLKDTRGLTLGSSDTKLSKNCYSCMFQGCTSLITAPELPAITLADYCYSDMFYGCTSLTTAPSILPANTLEDSCYGGMFSGCSALTTAPELPATTLSRECYYYMFYGCSSLTTAPALPATTLANRCYDSMFQNCISLTTAPELPATTLANYCYNSMFQGCTSLITAPELPAITLADYCYSDMFYGCTSLTAVHELSATTLANYCYKNMFWDCTSLTTVTPILPATKLTEGCYSSMFWNCSSLTAAPELPATTLVDWCYSSMFYGCTSLSYIKCLATDISAYHCTDGWVSGVASTGTFISNVDSSWPTGISGIPEGWDASQKEFVGLTFTAQEASTIGVSNKNGNAPDLWYAINSGSWVHWSDTYDIISLNPNDVMLVKGNNTNGFSLSNNKYTSFNITGNISISGSIMSLVNYKSDIPCNYCFIYLFYRCTGLKDASNLVLPATTLTSGCYQYMFLSCKNLKTSPELPATTLVHGCYWSMFSGCTSLTTAPSILPANTLEDSCYDGMFNGCSSLTKAPELPATTVAPYCCSYMFQNCTSLTTAPELPATTLESYCYWCMFYGCSALTNAPELPATTLAESCYDSMFSSCTSLTTAPELPAITTMFRYRCYQNMFNGCSSLNYIKCLAVNGINTNNSTTNWVSGVASTGTFVKDPNANWPTGTNGIPTNWTVVAEFKGLTFTAQEDNSSIGLNRLSTNQTLEYSMDLSVWNTFDTSTNISLNNGDKVYVRGKLNANNTYSNYTQFKMSGKIAASGNTNSIWDYEDLNAPLKPYCGYNLFYGCTSLTITPELPATTLAIRCYEGMFNNCSALTIAPALPANTLAQYCYLYMFRDCTNLTKAPELPATTLANGCYTCMFYGCTSLTTAPELPATTLVNYCYRYMFYGCSNLNYIKCLAVNGINTNYSTMNWVSRVPSSGTFVKDTKANWPTGAGGIPSGWTVEQVNYPGLKFVAIEDSEFSWTCNSSSFENKFYYSLDDGLTWTNYTNPIPFSKGTILCLKGDYPEGLSNNSRTVRFALSGKVKASGNIMSLIDNGACNTLTIPCNSCFRELFMDCTSLITPPELPATTLAYRCYTNMFYKCIRLIIAPALPATTLADYCYNSMFAHCTSLTTAPALPATTLANRCYDSMFYGCSSLIYPPTLPATTLAEFCYESMFGRCSSLVYPPELPATTLAYRCYTNMFYYCNNLHYIKCLAGNNINTNNTGGWVYGVPITGTFVKNPDANWPTGDSGIPSGWEVIDAK